MSCKTRAQLETTMETAFDELIENTALACEQIDTEQMHDLWIMAGILNISHDDMTGKNTLTWRDTGSSAQKINVGDLEFSGNKEQIYAKFPTEFYDEGVVRSFPVTAQVSPFYNLIREFSNGDEHAGYKISVNPTVSHLVISATIRVRLTARITYNLSTSAWNMVGLGKYPNEMNGQVVFTGGGLGYDNTTGVFKVKTDFKMTSCPTVFPYQQGGNVYTPFVTYVDSYNFEVVWWNHSANAMQTGPIGSNQIGFAVDFGTIDKEMNMEDTDFGDYAAINVLSIAQKDVL